MRQLQKTCVNAFKAVCIVQSFIQSTKCHPAFIYFSSEIQGIWEIGANRGDRRRKTGEKSGAEYGGNISEKGGGYTSK